MRVRTEVQVVLSELKYVYRRSNREDRPRLDRRGFGKAPLRLQGNDLQTCRSGTDTLVPCGNLCSIRSASCGAMAAKDVAIGGVAENAISDQDHWPIIRVTTSPKPFRDSFQLADDPGVIARSARIGIPMAASPSQRAPLSGLPIASRNTALLPFA